MLAMGREKTQARSACLPIAVLHHEVDRRRCIQHLVQGDDVGVSHSFKDFDFAADSLHIRDGLNPALLQDLSLRAQQTSRKTQTPSPVTQPLSMRMLLL